MIDRHLQAYKNFANYYVSRAYYLGLLLEVSEVTTVPCLVDACSLSEHAHFVAVPIH